MVKKEEKRRWWQVPDQPENLPLYAHGHWPDLAKMPTAADVKLFKRATRRDPDARVAVLSGLRSFAEAELNSLWAFIGVWISLLAVIVSGALTTPWIQLLIGVGLSIFAFLILARLGSASAELHLRRRRSIVWLRALEDGLRR